MVAAVSHGPEKKSINSIISSEHDPARMVNWPAALPFSTVAINAMVPGLIPVDRRNRWMERNGP